MSYSVAGSPPSRLYETIGNSDGVSRSIWMSSPGGSDVTTWLTRACTCWSANWRSVLSENVMLISEAPRMVRDCTRVTPGTMLTASSIGRVISKSTWRAPSGEPLTTTVMREKRSSG